MPARWAIAVWVAWLGLLGLATVLVARQVWNPSPILPGGLLVLMLAAGVGLVIQVSRRLIVGPERGRALAWLLVGMAPGWFFVGHVLLAFRPAFDPHVAPGWPSQAFLPVGRPLLNLEARWFYPERTAGKWVTMVGAGTPDARDQVAAMDRHVDALLVRLNQPKTWPITWYRGPLLGLKQCALYDMALGAEVGQGKTGPDGLTHLDRHEIAHCVITSNYTAGSDPPRLLMEGWAQANQGTSPEELAQNAWNDHQWGRSLTLRQLVAPDWYWHSGLATYNQGAPLVNYLLRVYGPERFLKLYTTSGQATFEADLQRTLGISLDDLDAAYWAEVEEVVTRTGPPARRWLKSLKLDPGVDPVAWDAFLADYFIAAAWLVAPYDHVRLKVTFRFGTDTGPDHPWPTEERQTTLRSGPFALVRQRGNNRDVAALAHPDHSILADRELQPTLQPWKIPVDYGALPEATNPDQIYRRSLRRIANVSDNHGFLATHGGAELLQYPAMLRDFSMPTDFVVSRLETSIRDGHHLVTLALRPSDETDPDQRRAFTFTFDRADSFVVRSIHYDFPTGSSDSQCDYDHPDGRPVLRSLVTTVPHDPKPPGVLRVDVEECRFGPIPESEFALEPFLASLGPGELVREPAVEYSTSTILDWYWLAFVGGGIILAGGLTLLARLK